MDVRLAVLGAGRIGRQHALAIAQTEGARLVAVSDPMSEAVEAVTSRFGGQSAEIDAIAADPDVDGVLICTPTDTHADLIERFAHVGKAIFCEKPVDLSVQRVRQCLTVVDETDAKLMVGFNRRFDPSFAAAHAAVRAGEVGEVELVQITSSDPGAPPIPYIKSSGGIFRDMTIHDLDMARFLMGEEPVTVYATGSVLTDPAIGEAGDYDTCTVTLTTASGKHCVITNSRRTTYGYDQRAEVHGSKGMVAVENPTPKTVASAGAGGFTRPPLHDFFMTRYLEAYAAEIAAFVGVIRDDTDPDPTGEDGLRSLILADAATQSARERRVITLEAAE
ncbi:MAG: inositol 2-dehydrogenase [Pseudomonadota bacterium]